MAICEPLDSSSVDVTNEVIVQHFIVPYEYPVHFTENLFDKDNSTLEQILTSHTQTGKQRALVFVDSGVTEALPDLCNQILSYTKARESLIDLVAEPVVIAGGESLKSDASTLTQLHQLVSRHKLDRHAYIIAIGGGALLDTIGLVAATAHRGIRHIRIPSTVLAQNDSGVGVKNGVNQFGKKNYLGTFAPPFAVINDYAFIDVLPERDKIAGMAEAVKVALIRDAVFFRWLEEHVEQLSQFDKSAMQYMIKRCAQLHLHQIAHGGDPFESGSARPLDFGHWSAHKLESLSEFDVRHGEAVAIGIALDTHYSVLTNFLEENAGERVYRLLRGLGFELWHPAIIAANANDQLQLLQGIEEFREHLGGQLTITLLESIGKGIEVNKIDRVTVCQCIDWLRRICGVDSCRRSRKQKNQTPRLLEQPSQHTERKFEETDVSVSKASRSNSSDESATAAGVIEKPSRTSIGSRSARMKSRSKIARLRVSEQHGLTKALEPDTDSACLFLLKRLKRQLIPKQFSWLASRLERLHRNANDRDLFITLGMIPRKLGRDDLSISPKDIIAAQTAAGVAWNPYGWSVDNEARCVVLGKLHSQQADRFEHVFNELCRSAELGESIAFYRCTAILPKSDATDLAIRAGLRTHIPAVFEAIAHGNPYPSLHFENSQWNQMILKALFINSTLWQIHGIDDRANEELAQMLCDYAHERWAAGRSVSPELWRCVGPFATPAMMTDLNHALKSAEPMESLAALMALLDCPHADHKQLQRNYPKLCEKINRGALGWERLGRNISDGN
ncbi:MAG: 3-dehydroquinate synthase [Granulosicoccus sp.]|nr:3-dehydroquinate synthase [Granulosicoccus sp.]